MDKYNIDFKKLIEWLLPVLKCKPVFISWLYAHLKYLRQLLNNFIAWGAEKKDEISWNGQTIVLKNLLIQKFGAGIWIENILREKRYVFGWPIHDTRNVNYFTIYNSNNPILYEHGVVLPDQISFIVHVPDTLIYDEVQMQAYIDKYKMLGTNYEIQLYTI